MSSANNKVGNGRKWTLTGAARAGAVAGVFGLMALGIASAQASAADEVVVHYSDLDLSTAAGAQRLYSRLQTAAAEVCPAVDSVELVQRVAAKRCVDKALEHAVDGINSPQLVAIYEARMHHGAHGQV